MTEIDDDNGRWQFTDPAAMSALWPGARFFALGGQPFAAVVLRRTLERCRIEGIGATPYGCERDAGAVARDPRDRLAIAVVVSGTCRVEHRGARIEAQEGDVFLHRTRTFRFECPTRGRTFRTVVDPSVIPGASREDYEPFEVCQRSTLTDAFARFAHEILRTTTSTPLLTRTATKLESALLTLQRGLIEDSMQRHSIPTGPGDDILLRALDHIERSLSDRDLTVDSTARAVGVSRRWLFKAFEHQSESVAGTIRRRRIEAAAAELTQSRKLLVGEVAARWGFASRDQFARAFRQHHGMSPNQYRDAALRDAFSLLGSAAAVEDGAAADASSVS